MPTHHKSDPQKSKSPETGTATGTLYIVATPIGNLGDMTFRAVETLKQVQVIACEDTRVSRTLLAHYGITTPTLSYREHNDTSQRPHIIARLQAGESMALVSDAGTPLISDPGYRLVADARAQHIPVVPIPGVSSVTTALCASGLPAERFTFLGFLPTRTKARQDFLRSILTLQSTLIFLESPQRLLDTLMDAVEILGDREAVVARELTKHFEEFSRGTLSQLHADYAARERIRGEIVLLIAPPAEQEAISEQDVDHLLQEALVESGVKQAAEQVAKLTGLSRSDLYERALQLKGRKVIAKPRSWGGAGGES